MSDPTEHDTPAWLNGWPRVGRAAVLIGTGVHCIGCGKFQGITSVALTADWVPPASSPTGRSPSPPVPSTPL